MLSGKLLMRSVTRLLVFAFAALTLVVLSCQGVNADSSTATPPASVIAAVDETASSAQGTTPVRTSAAYQEHVPVLTVLREDQTRCQPGRTKARVERSTTAPSPAHLQPPSSSTAGQPFLPRRGFHSQFLRAGRVPAALTHLDLGIVRT